MRCELTAYHFLVAIAPHVYSIYLERTTAGLAFTTSPASHRRGCVLGMINEASAISGCKQVVVTCAVAMSTELPPAGSEMFPQHRVSQKTR